MKIKYFFKQDCPKCPAAKEVIKKFEDFVEYYDLDTVDGLAEGAYYMVSSTPTTVIVDEEGREVVSWRGSLPPESEIRSLTS